MAKNKESFILYCDLIHTVKKMPKDKVAELFIHILEYVNDLNPQTDDLILNLVFEPIKQQLKRDLKKWEDVCNRNKINGIKGGRPKNPKEPKKADSDNDSDNDINNNPTSIKVDWSALIKQFNSITGKKTKVISPIVKTKILARLKEGYSKQDFLNAIENCYNDKWHKETNHKHLTLEFISRPDKLERFSTQKT